tara:strand:+ start:237 stop:707 length:471 start_codon:yes stop_codon:yes gene_type:complete
LINSYIESLNIQKGNAGMHFQVKLLVFATSWMVFRAVGSALFLTLGAIGSDRSASSDWTIAFLGDFVIGSTALFLAYNIWKKPSALLWGILLAWNAVGIFDLFGALSHSFSAPFSPFPEIGINEISIRTILSLNTLIQFVALLLMFRPEVKAYFKV